MKCWIYWCLFSTISMMLVRIHVNTSNKSFSVSTIRFLAKIGLMHIGVFILLLLSGERNFGVRLNKPYATRVHMDIPIFTGTHADLLIIVRRNLSFIHRYLPMWMSFVRFFIRSSFRHINVCNLCTIVYWRLLLIFHRIWKRYRWFQAINYFIYWRYGFSRTMIYRRRRLLF